MKPIQIEDVKRLVVEPGDIILVRISDQTFEGINELQKMLADQFPGVPFLVHDGSVEFTTVRNVP